MEKKNASFIIVRGAPGSGKTTFANRLKLMLGAASTSLFETDNFFVDQVDGRYRFDPSLLGTAHAWNQGEVVRFCRDYSECPLIVANTMTRNSEVKAYLKIAKLFDRPVTVFTLKTQHENKHGVPAEKVQTMRDRMQDLDLDRFKMLYNIEATYEIICDEDKAAKIDQFLEFHT